MSSHFVDFVDLIIDYVTTAIRINKHKNKLIFDLEN